MDLAKEIGKQIKDKRAEIQRLEKEVRGLEGARVALGGSARRGRPAARKVARPGRRAKRGENQKRVLAALSRTPMGVKDIASSSGVTSPSVNAVLSLLTKAGLVVKKGRGQYALKGKARPAA